MVYDKCQSLHGWLYMCLYGKFERLYNFYLDCFFLKLMKVLIVRCVCYHIFLSDDSFLVDFFLIMCYVYALLASNLL